jgi:hypothetical protein
MIDHFDMGLPPSPNLGENYFELIIPPFLGLHPIFNVDLLHSYFPPLLDTLEVVEHLTPTKIYYDFLE